MRKKKALNVYVSDTQREKMKEEAEATGISMSSLVKNMINKHFSKGVKKHEN